MKADQTKQRTLADEHYDDIGRSVAGLVVDGGTGTAKAWAMLSGLYLYKRWMLSHWIARYEEESRKPPGAPGGGRKRNRVTRGAEWTHPS